MSEGVSAGLTITEACKSVHRGHGDDECKKVVNNCVEKLVRHHAPRHVGHRLELVVDKQLRRHLDEPFEQRVSE